MEGLVTLDRADNIDNADNTNLDISPSPGTYVTTGAKLWRGWRRTRRESSGRGWTRGDEQLFTVQEAIQMCGRPHGLHQVVPLDLR